ncbi:hypothetical protein GCM10010873_16340 [Cypionkella aquatica]|uniref:Uncharacterized protein n=1 Tax=Cypionkella aquatica TaxID=1756042 RepID=A0AA37X1C4_9RHOB|nr:hypothetical protein [Cypionkella aquatica]GLS86660.1 hypothetical protein GCM10010873_16340 [Cypionkella aquatica]
MSYMLRDRPDGQFEIVLSRPILVGIFPEKDVASRVMFFLQEEEIELPEQAVSSFGQALRDAAAAEAETQASLLDVVEVKRASPPLRHTPAVVAKPKVPAVRPKTAPLMVVSDRLTEAQLEEAFARISSGEKLNLIAPTFDLTVGQLRSVWAQQCRKLQEHLAGGGKVPCAMCKTPFVPSISHPDSCARCSRD